MIAKIVEEQPKISMAEYLDSIPEETSLEQVEDSMKVKINKDLDIEYIKSRLACLIILSSDQDKKKSGILECFILNQLAHGDTHTEEGLILLK